MSTVVIMILSESLLLFVSCLKAASRLSRPTGRWDLIRSHVYLSVRSSVRLSHFFLETVYYFFLKLYSKLGLLGARKMFQALFWSFSPFWPFWPKTVQNGPFWPYKWQKNFYIFSRTTHHNFLIFCSKHSLWSRKIITLSLFGGNFKNGSVWRKLTQIWPEFG